MMVFWLKKPKQVPQKNKARKGLSLGTRYQTNTKAHYQLNQKKMYLQETTSNCLPFMRKLP